LFKRKEFLPPPDTYNELPPPVAGEKNPPPGPKIMVPPSRVKRKPNKLFWEGKKEQTRGVSKKKTGPQSRFFNFSKIFSPGLGGPGGPG